MPPLWPINSHRASQIKHWPVNDYEIDDPRNDVNNKIISTTSSKVLIMVVKADEESVIAQETHQALSAIVEPSPPVQIAP